MNKVFLIGNLTRDPEARTTQGGVAVTSFTLALNRRYTNADGRREADFVPVITWRQTAEACAKYLAKGRKVAVCGSLQTRSYDGQDGMKHYVTEVIADEVEFLSSGSREQAPLPAPPPDRQDAPGGFTEVDDDELPF